MSRILTPCEKRMVCGRCVSAKRKLRPLMDNGLSCNGKTGKLAHVRMMLQMKIAGMEHRVVKITRRVANWGSRLYLDDSMTVVAPAGMAASKVLTPVTVLLTGSS